MYDVLGMSESMVWGELEEKRESSVRLSSLFEVVSPPTAMWR